MIKSWHKELIPTHLLKELNSINILKKQLSPSWRELLPKVLRKEQILINIAAPNMKPVNPHEIDVDKLKKQLVDIVRNVAQKHFPRLRFKLSNKEN